MPIPTKDEFRAEFHKLQKQKAELELQLEPLKEKYEAARERERQFYEKEVKPHEEAQRVVKDVLADCNTAIGQIVRYLRDGKGVAETGDPADFAA